VIVIKHLFQKNVEESFDVAVISYIDDILIV